MKYTKYLAILAAAFMMGSCSDDFLDKEPSENASEDQIKDLLDKDPTAIQSYTKKCEVIYAISSPIKSVANSNAFNPKSS